MFKNFLKWFVFTYWLLLLTPPGWNEKLLEILLYPCNSRAFYGPELNLLNRAIRGGRKFSIHTWKNSVLRLVNAKCKTRRKGLNLEILLISTFLYTYVLVGVCVCISVCVTYFLFFLFNKKYVMVSIYIWTSKNFQNCWLLLIAEWLLYV